MRKTLTYSSFAVVSLALVIAFVTAKTYTQLAIATALYPFLAYFAYYLFSRQALKVRPQISEVKNISTDKPRVDSHQAESVSEPSMENNLQNHQVASVLDIDRRAFLKLIGATGISFFLFSLLGRRVENLVFNQPQGPSMIPADGETTASGLLPTDKYRISEIDDSKIAYYGFTDLKGGWFIMKEDEEGSFRYTKGESNFAGNWARRESHVYDYYHKVF